MSEESSKSKVFTLYDGETLYNQFFALNESSSTPNVFIFAVSPLPWRYAFSVTSRSERTELTLTSISSLSSKAAVPYAKVLIPIDVESEISEFIFVQSKN